MGFGSPRRGILLMLFALAMFTDIGTTRVATAARKGKGKTPKPPPRGKNPPPPPSLSPPPPDGDDQPPPPDDDDDHPPPPPDDDDDHPPPSPAFPPWSAPPWFPPTPPPSPWTPAPNPFQPGPNPSNPYFNPWALNPWCPQPNPWTPIQPPPQPRKIFVGPNQKWDFGTDYAAWANDTWPFYVSDTLVFRYDPLDPKTGRGHSVFLLPDLQHYITCNLTGGVKIADPSQGGGNGFEFQLTMTRPHYFACGEHDGIHCGLGRMKFMILPWQPCWF